MERQYIALMDSGIGGISVLHKLIKKFPNESFLYFGDNDNAPYGNRSKQNLLSLTMNNINQIKRYDIKALILACNTLSVNLIKEIEEYSSIKTFGIFPPVERCQVEQEKTILLATKRTATNYSPSKNFDCLGLLDLANIIEENKFNLSKINIRDYLEAELNKNNLKRDNYQTVILGCTHYNFVKNQISDHFRPQKLIDGTENLILKLSNFLKNNKSLENIKQNHILFVGNNAQMNLIFFNKSGHNI